MSKPKAKSKARVSTTTKPKAKPRKRPTHFVLGFNYWNERVQFRPCNSETEARAFEAGYFEGLNEGADTMPDLYVIPGDERKAREWVAEYEGEEGRARAAVWAEAMREIAKQMGKKP